MHRAGQLFERIADLENLRAAYLRAAQGKRGRAEVLRFAARLDSELAALASSLRDGTIVVGRFQQFLIHDPKQRVITAPCFRERVLHHAVMRTCEPVFEKWLIDDTFACRRGRGRLEALHRAQKFARRDSAFFKLDIRKYFDSISHNLLLERLARMFRERRLLDLFEKIVRQFRGEMNVGLPIGSLTSQHFANCYLGTFDRFVKEELRIGGYVRYMDDMVIWGNSPRELRTVADQCREFLGNNLRLSMKAEPEINFTSHGMDFLGCRLFPTHIELNRRSRLRFRRQMTRLERDAISGRITDRELQQRATALVAFTRAGGVASWHWRSRVIKSLPVSGHKARSG